MDVNVISALISLSGSIIGTLGGIWLSARMTTYRIEQLERKVDKHNNFAERMPVIEEQIKVINHRIEDLEKESKHE